MVLTTDACEYGYGAVLEQIIDRESQPIAYFSKNYTAAQKKYSTERLLDNLEAPVMEKENSEISNVDENETVRNNTSELVVLNADEQVELVEQVDNQNRIQESDILIKEQNDDEDIKWIKDFIKIHGDKNLKY
ncbi:unnamed protein product [Brachionus calyciflorus]|uniref:Reverse transcriptase/retrotransposon-derived protein RNase H-like domain-containing protein n=1 Tax=Brachionus calyciflorus TaxID=104777 RepID=A0A814MIP4_9BILA|nr:unnamed protein product [Brachionus calyciflorus]